MKAVQTERRARSGATVIELMVVTVILVVLTIGLSRAVTAALALEQAYREESAVRTALAHHLAYAERYLSLANGRNIHASGGTNVFIFEYPTETGGVSFETNHWIRVTSNRVYQSRFSDGVTNLHFTIYSGDERWSSDVSRTRVFSGDGHLRIARNVNIMEATFEPMPGNIVMVTLTADIPWRTGRREATNTVISVSRPVRLWNQ